MREVAYHMPNNIETLERILTESKKPLGIVAGGTDFMIKYRAHPDRYEALLDISGVKELSKIIETDEYIHIGSLVTLTEVSESSVIQIWCPALSKAAGMVGSTQIRNRGTVAGNIANASPCADTAPPLMAYDAKVKTYHPEHGVRIKTVDDVMVGMGKNMLLANEVILGVIIPKIRERKREGFMKVGSRKAVTISKLNLCIVLILDEKNIVVDARVAIGSLGPKAFRIEKAEALLSGQTCERALLTELSNALSEQVVSSISGRSSMPYKRQAVKGLADDVLTQILAEREEA